MAWGGGVSWRLGDEFNGWKAEGCADSMTLAIEALAKAAQNIIRRASSRRGGNP